MKDVRGSYAVSRRNVNGPVVLLFAALVPGAHAQQPESSPRQEVGLTSGGLLSRSRTAPQTRLELRSGTAWQANYAYRLAGGNAASLYAEVHFLASPQRLVTSPDVTLTRDVASLFVTPGIRLKFFPRSRLAPYAAIGGGYALYEHSLTRIDGQPNPAPRSVHHGALDFGGGVDVRLWRFVGLRFEVRDFYTGSPAYNTPSLLGGQHNVVAGGGLLLRF